jgi:hypothetical protein
MRCGGICRRLPSSTSGGEGTGTDGTASGTANGNAAGKSDVAKQGRRDDIELVFNERDATDDLS